MAGTGSRSTRSPGRRRAGRKKGSNRRGETRGGHGAVAGAAGGRGAATAYPGSPPGRFRLIEPGDPPPPRTRPAPVVAPRLPPWLPDACESRIAPYIMMTRGGHCI